MAQRPRPFRFTIGLGESVAKPELIGEFARKAEALGYSILTIGDHFGVPSSPFMGLLVAAAATRTIRLGTLVIDNDFRHPAVLAKEAATFDVLSGGRLELGVGAGWRKREYEQAGIAFDRAGLRIERLAETLEILSGLFAPGPFSFTGKHYLINELDGSPKPLQQPRPPLHVGGGSRRILTVAGRYADAISISTTRADPTGQIDARDLLPDALQQKLGWIAEGASSRLLEIELGVSLFYVNVCEDRKAVAEALLNNPTAKEGTVQLGIFKLKLPEDFGVEDLLSSPFLAIGSPGEIARHFEEQRDRFGISVHSLQSDAAEPFAPVIELLAS